MDQTIYMMRDTKTTSKQAYYASGNQIYSLSSINTWIPCLSDIFPVFIPVVLDTLQTCV